MKRTMMRELAFQLLYQLELQKELNEEVIEIFCNTNDISNEEAKNYIKEMVNGIQKNEKNITKVIQKNLKQDWKIERISKVDIAILKLAIYEILYKELAYKIAINEAVELAKKYGEDQSPAFINGILASVLKEKA